VPVVYRCSNCGFVLYVFTRVGETTRGISSPGSVIALYGGVCPRCGKPLRLPTLRDIKVSVDARGEMEKLMEEHIRMLAEMENAIVAARLRRRAPQRQA